MKIKTSNLTGAALDWAVAKCMGHAVTVLTVQEQEGRWFENTPRDEMYKERRAYFDAYILPLLRPRICVVGDAGFKRSPTHQEAPVLFNGGAPVFEYSTSWVQGGPIIEREGMSVIPFDDRWEARGRSALLGTVRFVERRGPTLLIAAMRCYVASCLGDEVEVPDELINERNT